jgi:hypothetical protein
MSTDEFLTVQEIAKRNLLVAVSQNSGLDPIAAALALFRYPGGS